MLRREQQRRLAASEPEIAPCFVDGVDGLPDGPLLLVANEFLDALPIRQLVRSRNGWAERLVALEPGSEPESERLIFVEGPESPALALLVPPGLRDAPPGTVVEICPAAAALAASLGERLAHAGPAWPCSSITAISRADPARLWPRCAVTERRRSSTLPERRISAPMSISRLSPRPRQRRGAASHGPVTQRDFLLALGAEARLAALSRRATPAQREAL